MIQIDTQLANIREVDGDELRNLCADGWQLICVFQEKSVGVTEESLPCPGPPQPNQPCIHGCYTNCTFHVRQGIVGDRQKTRYIVGQPPDEAFSALHQQIEQLQTNLLAAQRACATANKAQKEAEEDLTKVARQKEAAEARAALLEKDLSEQRCQTLTRQKEVSQLEAQMTRLRAEFGEREVRRVLGE